VSFVYFIPCKTDPVAWVAVKRLWSRAIYKYPPSQTACVTRQSANQIWWLQRRLMYKGVTRIYWSLRWRDHSIPKFQYDVVITSTVQFFPLALKCGSRVRAYVAVIPNVVEFTNKKRRAWIKNVTKIENRAEFLLCFWNNLWGQFGDRWTATAMQSVYKDRNPFENSLIYTVYLTQRLMK